MMPATPNNDAWEELRARQELQEHRFQSRVPVLGPLIVALRSLWNSVATKWYVRPLFVQQSIFNRLLVDRLVVQARAAEAQIARLNEIEARIVTLQQLVQDLQTQTAQAAALSESLSQRVQELTAQIAEHDDWFGALDREQSHLAHDLAEVAAQVVQLQRQLADSQQPAFHLKANEPGNEGKR